MTSRRARVIDAHRAPDRPAIQVAAGDEVTLGDRDTEWPQFVWAALASGLGGWVPTAVFDTESGPARALNDYDTTELTADAGDTVTAHHEQSGWYWAENAQGVRGWIPARKLELLDD